MHDFTLAQETDGVPYVRLVAAVTQDVVVRHTGFLLRREVFVNVRQGIARRCERIGVERFAARILGVDAGGMVDKIGVVASGFDLFRGQVACELVDDGADHFKMAQLFCTYF